MHAMEFIIEWLTIFLQLWIVLLMARNILHKRFPMFFGYMVYITIVDVARAILIGRASYFYVYWWTEAIVDLMSVLAIYESFRSIFGTYYRIAWFRFIWPGAIAVIWIYCIWQAWVHPPPHFGRTGAILISGAIVSSFTIAGLALLFFLLVKLVITRWYLYEFNIVYGIGISSVGMVVAVLIRSEFGNKFIWLTEWGPPLAYLVAVIVWLSAFLRKEPQIRIDTPPEVLLQKMQEDLNVVQRISRRFQR